MPEPINVLIVSPWYKPQIGGVVETVANLVGGLQTKGVMVTLLLSGSSNSIEKIGTDGLAEIFSFRMRSGLMDGFGLRSLAAWLVMFVPTVLKLRKFVKDRGITVVNIHFPSSQHVYFLLLRLLLSVKIVVSVHGSDIHLIFPKGRLNKRLTRLLLRNCDILVACSQILWEDTRRAIGKNPNCRTEIIHGGVQSDWLVSKEEAGIDRGENYILAVGTLRAVKGFDILIKAIGMLGDRLQGYQVHIYGDGPAKEELSELAESLDLADKIIFKGSIPHEDLPPIFSGALFYVLPSRSEGLPLVALEAQARGRAVIASSVGGIPEFIEDGVNGILVPAEDARELSLGIARMIDDPNLRSAMGQAGLQKVKAGFTWEINSEKYFDVISTLMRTDST